jgi:hypothetical protein
MIVFRRTGPIPVTDVNNSENKYLLYFNPQTGIHLRTDGTEAVGAGCIPTPLSTAVPPPGNFIVYQAPTIEDCHTALGTYDTAWHVLLIRDGVALGLREIHLDGAESHHIEVEPDPFFNELRIGGSANAGQYFWGDIAEIAIWKADADVDAVMLYARETYLIQALSGACAIESTVTATLTLCSELRAAASVQAQASASLTLPQASAISAFNIETSTLALFRDFLCGYFDGAEHEVGPDNPPIAFPAATLRFQQQGLPQPLDGLAITMTWGAPARFQRRWDRNGEFLQEFGYGQAQWNFWVRASGRPSAGTENPDYVCRRGAETLFALLNHTAATLTLARHGIHHVRATSPQLVSEGRDAKGADIHYSTRLLICTGRLRFPISAVDENRGDLLAVNDGVLAVNDGAAAAF